MASNSVSKQSETSKMASLRSKPRKIRTVIKYKECMRNHAASMGGHAVDGCCEFTARDDHDQDLLCEACGCHRNFHRKEMIHNGVPMNITSRYVAPTTTSVLLIGPNNCHEYLWTGEERKVIVLRPTPHPPPGFSKIHHPDHHHHYNYEHRVLYGHDHHEVELAGKKPNLTKKPKMEL